MCLKMCLKMKCFNCFYTKRSDRHSHKMTNSSSKASGEPPVHTLTSQPNPRHEQPIKQDCKETAKTTQSKQGQAEGIPKEDAVVLKEWSFKTRESSITDGKTGKMTADLNQSMQKSQSRALCLKRGTWWIAMNRGHWLNAEKAKKMVLIDWRGRTQWPKRKTQGNHQPLPQKTNIKQAQKKT